MQGVTTAIVAFIFVCIIYPHIVKHRAQYYWAMAIVLVIILLDALAHMVAGPGPTDPAAPYHPSSFSVFAYVMIGLMQVVAILLLIMSAGGLTVRQLAGEMASAYEVMRRGEEHKEIIIPLHGQMPGRKAADDSPRERINLDLPEESPPPKKAGGGGASIPLDE